VKRVIPTQDFPISRLQSAREVFSSQQACEPATPMLPPSWKGSKKDGRTFQSRVLFAGLLTRESIHVKIAIYETNKPALLCCDMKLYIGDHVESI
jgi:hypothetical protein